MVYNKCFSFNVMLYYLDKDGYVSTETGNSPKNMSFHFELINSINEIKKEQILDQDTTINYILYRTNPHCLIGYKKNYVEVSFEKTESGRYKINFETQNIPSDETYNSMNGALLDAIRIFREQIQYDQEQEEINNNIAQYIKYNTDDINDTHDDDACKIF